MQAFRAHLSDLCLLTGAAVAAAVAGVLTGCVVMRRTVWDLAVLWGVLAVGLWACLLWDFRHRGVRLGLVHGKCICACTVCWAPVIVAMVWNPLHWCPATMVTLATGLGPVMILTFVVAAMHTDTKQRSAVTVTHASGIMVPFGRPKAPRGLPRHALASPAA